MKNEKLKMLGQPVRMLAGGRLMTVFLTDYDVSSDSYNGEAHSNVHIDVGEDGPIIRSVVGARPYPYTERPNYSFQYVLPGEDEQPLLDIATANQKPGEKPVEDIVDGDIPGSLTPAGEPSEPDRPLTNRERKNRDRHE